MDSAAPPHTRDSHVCVVVCDTPHGTSCTSHTHSVEPYLPENRAHIWVRARNCACVFLSTACCAAGWCWLRVTGVLVMDGPDDATSDTARKEASLTGELWFKGGGCLRPPKVEFLLKTQTKWGLREICAQNVNINVDELKGFALLVFVWFFCCFFVYHQLNVFILCKLRIERLIR